MGQAQYVLGVTRRASNGIILPAKFESITCFVQISDVLAACGVQASLQELWGLDRTSRPLSAGDLRGAALEAEARALRCALTQQRLPVATAHAGIKQVRFSIVCHPAGSMSMGWRINSSCSIQDTQCCTRAALMLLLQHAVEYGNGV